MPRREPNDGFRETLQLGRLLFGRVDPGDILPAISRREFLEECPGRLVLFDRLFNVSGHLGIVWRVAVFIRRRPRQARLPQTFVGLELGISLSVGRGPAAVELSWRKLAS